MLTVPEGEDAQAARQSILRSSISSANNAEANTIRLDIEYRKYSYATLQHIRDQISKLHGKLGTTMGRLPVTWGIDTNRNIVQIGVHRLNDTILQAASDTYGEAVSLHEEAPLDLTVGRVTLDHRPKMVKIDARSSKLPSDLRLQEPNRLLDGLPYYSGHRLIQINGNTASWCTNGWHPQDRRKAFSAGHCFAENSTVLQGYFDETDGFVYYTGELGNVEWRQYGDGTFDAEAIYPAVPVPSDIIGNRMYTGSVTTPGDIPIGGAASSTVGSTVCTNGSVTGEVCRGIVTIVDGCASVDDIIMCGMDTAQAPSGVRIVEHGDSGGPVIRHDSLGQALFHGIIAAGNVGAGEGQGPGDRVVYSNAMQVCLLDSC